MITLNQRLKKQQDTSKTSSRISVRDKLLTREIQEMSQLLPSNCTISYNNINELSAFVLTVKPVEGFWQDGSFKFTIQVTEEYNMVPPKVHCVTRLWHPNISETGEVCLSILRTHSVDGLGWSPTRRLKDVIWGLNSLFTDLLNFDDPLNLEAAEMYRTQKEKFRKKVKDYVELYAREN